MMRFYEPNEFSILTSFDREKQSTWLNEMENNVSLKFSEAQALFIKIKNSDNPKIKEKLRTKLILETMPILAQFITKTHLLTIKSVVFDTNDLANSLLEAWIRVLDSGKILECSDYRFLFDFNFYNYLSQSLEIDKLDIMDIGQNISSNMFMDLLITTIKAKEKGQDIPIYELKKIYNMYNKLHISWQYIYVAVYPRLEAIYQALSGLDFTDNKIDRPILFQITKLLWALGLDLSCLSLDEVAVEYESKYLNKETDKWLIEKIFTTAFLNQEEKELLQKRYGLGDIPRHTMKELAEVQNLDYLDILRQEGQVLRKIRRNTRIMRKKDCL